MAMFDFIKGLSVFRVVTEPCADRFLLLGGLAVALHHALDVGGFCASLWLPANIKDELSSETPKSPRILYMYI